MPSYSAGGLAPSTIATLRVPEKLYSENLVLPAPSLFKLINVTTALSAGLETNPGLIAKVCPPVPLASAVTVYTLSTPATVNMSPI